jgi:hypothetical protein
VRDARWFDGNELALKHGAGVREETTDSREAYAGSSEPKPIACPPAFSELVG